MTQRILTAPPLPLLLRMATPNAIAFFVQAGVSMAEAWFIARLGVVPLAGIALMFPILMLMQMLANGAMGGGVSSAIARALGAGDLQRADALLWHALAIAVGAGILFGLLYVLSGTHLLALTSAPTDVTRAADDYGSVLFLGMIPVWASALLNAAVRGSGNMQLPALLMIGSAVLQVPIAGTLILGVGDSAGLGLPGAAVAVIITSTINAVILGVYLWRRPSSPRLHLDALRLEGRHFAAIFQVGLVASLSPFFVVLTVTCINVLIGRFGMETLAGYGIVARLEFLLVPLVFGFGAAMVSLVGTNVGANQLDRAEHIGWVGGGCSALACGIVGITLALFPVLWLGLFAVPETPPWQTGETYLQIVGPAFLFQGLGLSLYFASQGAGAVQWPVIATILRFVIAVGAAWVGVHHAQLSIEYVFACIAAGMAVYGVVTAAAIRLGAWRPSRDRKGHS
jgi:putative MATE family efflux protein